VIERDEMKTTQHDPLLTSGADSEERHVEVGLRPQSLREFVGQDALKDSLQVTLDAAKKRKEPIEHVLLYGNPGLGKTTLAHIIAR